MATDGIHSGVTNLVKSVYALHAYLFERVVDAIS